MEKVCEVCGSDPYFNELREALSIAREREAQARAREQKNGWDRFAADQVKGDLEAEIRMLKAEIEGWKSRPWWRRLLRR